MFICQINNNIKTKNKQLMNSFKCVSYEFYEKLSHLLSNYFCCCLNVLQTKLVCFVIKNLNVTIYILQGHLGFFWLNYTFQECTKKI